MQARHAAVLLLVVGACHRVQSVAPPEISDDFESLLLVVEAEGIDRVRAYEDPKTFPVVSLGGEGAVLALYYLRPLAELGLTAGDLRIADNNESDRPLPTPQVGLRADYADAQLSPWAPLLADDGTFARIRLPGRPVEACLQSEGCYAEAVDVEDRTCSFGCPERVTPAPASPARAPAATDLRPCALGWSEVVDGEVTHCEPGATARCADDEAWWPSEGRCRRLGTDCPEANRWAPDLPSDRPIVYVRPGAISGDGSIDAPFGTLFDAAGAAPSDAVIALTPGDYTASISTGVGITVWGACVSGTVLRGRGAAALRLVGGQGGLRNLTVQGPSAGVESVGGTSRAEIADVAFVGIDDGPALSARTATLTARRFTVRNGSAPAIEARGGASMRVSQAEIGDVGGFAAFAREPRTVLRIDDVWLFADARVNQTDGAVSVRDGAQVTLRGSLVAGFRGRGLRVTDVTASLGVEDVIVQSIGSPSGAVGIEVLNGATLTASRLRIEEVQGEAILVRNGQFTGDRVFVRAPARNEVGHVVQVGGRLELGRSTVQGGSQWGIRSQGSPSAQLILRDLRILDTVRPPGLDDDLRAIGLWVSPGVDLDVARLAVHVAQTHGIALWGSSTEPPIRGTLTDVTVREVTARAAATGHAIWAADGTDDVTLLRVHVEDVRAVGVRVTGSGRLRVEDAHIEDAGMGLRVEESGQLEVSRVVLQANRATGVCLRASSTLTAEDLVLRSTRGPSMIDGNWVCGAGTPAFGEGIVANSLTSLSLERYWLVGNAGPGLVALGEGATASDGLIEDHALGMQVAPGVDPAAVLVRTRFSNNEQDVELRR